MTVTEREIANDLWLKQVFSWTHAHYAEKITLQNVLDLTHFTKGYFCYRFKKLTGKTYIQYVNEYRLERACEYLRQGYSVDKTAKMSGFSSTNYFVQMFKRSYGSTPGKYLQIER